ncbi:MAG: HAD hydrolase-like protein, partial [Pseudomonadota bacterium]
RRAVGIDNPPPGQSGDRRGKRRVRRQVLAARGLSDAFDAVYGVEHAEFRPKPERAAFGAILARDGFRAETAAMFEDEPRNLAAPHDMGMATVHVAPKAVQAPHIHHHTDDLTAFLGALV